MTDQTINYYNQNASMFSSDTISADMADAQKRFLDALQQKHPDDAIHDLAILDFGCGTGRDTKYFLAQGYAVSAFDGSKELAAKASAYTGIPVANQLFQDFRDDRQYDGIWACASILHLPKEELLPVLQNIGRALKQNGVFYTSFKYGSFAGYRGSRYYTDLTEQTLNSLIQQVPSLKLIEEWISADVRPGRDQEKWINIIAVKE